MKIAIIGTGVSGLVAAHHLHDHHDLTIFEAGDRIGGHANTRRVDLPEESFDVDTGFVVYNERNYPNFTRILEELEVPTQRSDMSFSVSDPARRLEYRATNIASLFAQRRNLLRPCFHRLIGEILRFHRRGRAFLADPDESVTLGQFLSEGRFSELFVEDFLLPLGSAIWSADPTTFDEFPMASLAGFLANHGLLSLGEHPEWRTVSGGSRTYVDAISAPFSERIRMHCPIDKVMRTERGVEVLPLDGTPEQFDGVVLACHSDQALRLLSDPTADERSILGAIRYTPNEVVLHTDRRLLPANRRAWASWNAHVLGSENSEPTLTYWMNNLQGLETDVPILVSLNRTDVIDPETVIERFDYSHPFFDLDAIRAQRRRDEIQGVGRTWFAGAYWGYGFHEDGARSGLDVARSIDGALRSSAPVALEPRSAYEPEGIAA